MSALDEIEQLSFRLAKLERQVAYLFEHLELEYQEPAGDSDASPEVMEFVHSGKKIEAIKRYRQETGVGLKQAKEFIESLSK